MAKQGAPVGNNNAGNGASFRDALRYEIAKLGRSIEGDDVALVKGMRAIAAPLVEAAAVDKDKSAIREVADRMDGKATQAVELSGPDGEAMQTIVYNPVAPKD